MRICVCGNVEAFADSPSLCSDRPAVLQSGAGDITLKDVPLHEEVKSFAEQLCKYLDGNYEMASEHEHSCCVLISDTKLKKNGKWHTWIDYPKFNQLVTEYYRTGKTFTAEDYGAETPAWAVYGAKEAGFSPLEVKKTGKRQRLTHEQLNAKYPMRDGRPSVR
jgi:tRNA wybutosine-synthesizing protein 1